MESSLTIKGGPCDGQQVDPSVVQNTDWPLVLPFVRKEEDGSIQGGRHVYQHVDGEWVYIGSTTRLDLTGEDLMANPDLSFRGEA